MLTSASFFGPQKEIYVNTFSSEDKVFKVRNAECAPSFLKLTPAKDFNSWSCRLSAVAWAPPERRRAGQGSVLHSTVTHGKGVRPLEQHLTCHTFLSRIEDRWLPGTYRIERMSSMAPFSLNGKSRRHRVALGPANPTSELVTGSPDVRTATQALPCATCTL